MSIVHTPRKIHWETQFLGGLNLRSLLILAITLPLAGALLFTPLLPGPFGLRLAAAIGLAVVGLVLVFARFAGRPFERWAADVLAWQHSGRRWVWRRGTPPATTDALWAPAPRIPPQEKAARRPHPRPAAAARPALVRTEAIAVPEYTVLGLTFNLVVLLLLTALTVYLAGGASVEVSAWLRGLAGSW